METNKRKQQIEKKSNLSKLCQIKSFLIVFFLCVCIAVCVCVCFSVCVSRTTNFSMASWNTYKNGTVKIIMT